jgi:hypothetical protein
MRVLFVLVLAVAVVSVGLLVEMERRDEPALGLSALGLLTADGVLGAASARRSRTGRAEGGGAHARSATGVRSGRAAAAARNPTAAAPQATRIACRTVTWSASRPTSGGPPRNAV